MWKNVNPKEGSIPRSLLRKKLMTNEVSLGLIPRSMLRGVSLEEYTEYQNLEIIVAFLSGL